MLQFRAYEKYKNPKNFVHYLNTYRHVILYTYIHSYIHICISHDIHYTNGKCQYLLLKNQYTYLLKKTQYLIIKNLLEALLQSDT